MLGPYSKKLLSRWSRASFCICLRKSLPSLQRKRTFIESTCSYISCNFKNYVETPPGATDAQILITSSILLRSTRNFDTIFLRYYAFISNKITISSMNKTKKYLRYWVQIYCGCSARITFYEWNSISVIWPPRARLQRSILWSQFATTLAHISNRTLAISRWMLSLRTSKVAGFLT